MGYIVLSFFIFMIFFILNLFLPKEKKIQYVGILIIVVVLVSIVFIPINIFLSYTQEVEQILKEKYELQTYGNVYLLNNGIRLEVYTRNNEFKIIDQPNDIIKIKEPNGIPRLEYYHYKYKNKIAQFWFPYIDIKRVHYFLYLP